jgi:hypothetical protein
LAKRNHKEANHILGLDALQSKSFANAVKYFCVAAEQGFGPSQSILGNLHLIKVCGTVKVYMSRKMSQKRWNILKRPTKKVIDAYLGIPEAAANLAQFYLDGTGVDADRKHAFALLNSAALKGTQLHDFRHRCSTAQRCITLHGRFRIPGPEFGFCIGIL